MNKKYLHGIVENQGITEFGDLGLGRGEQTVTAVAAGRVAAVVSEYPDTPPVLAPRWVGWQRAIHRRVVEAMMLRQPILPTGLGIVMANESAIRAALAASMDQLVDALDRYGNAVEYSVLARWDVGAQLDTIAQDREMAKLQAIADGRTGEEALWIRYLIGQNMKRSLRKRQLEVACELMAELGDPASDRRIVTLPRWSCAAEMAFLVAKGLDAQFLKTLERASPRHAGKLSLSWVGPLPPGSFARVELAQPYEESGCDLLRVVRPSQLMWRNRVLEFEEQWVQRLPRVCGAESGTRLVGAARRRSAGGEGGPLSAEMERPIDGGRSSGALNQAQERAI